MNSTISVNARTFNPSKISFAIGTSKNNRVPPINMKYGDDEKTKGFFQILLPQSVVRLLTRPDDKTGIMAYTLSYTLSGCDNMGKDRGDTDTEMGKLYNSLMDLEETVVKAAVENSVKWFGKKRSEDVIRDSFKKIIRVSSDRVDGESVPNGKYPPSWWIKIPVYDGKVSIDNEGIVNNLGHPMENVVPSNLEKIFPNNSQAKLAVAGSIYVMAGGGFGVTWKLRAAQVFPSSRVRAVDLFGITDDDDGQDVQHSNSPVEESVLAPIEEVAVQEYIVPAAPPRKKRGAAGQ